MTSQAAIRQALYRERMARAEIVVPAIVSVELVELLEQGGLLPRCADHSRAQITEALNEQLRLLPDLLRHLGLTDSPA